MAFLMTLANQVVRRIDLASRPKFDEMAEMCLESLLGVHNYSLKGVALHRTDMFVHRTFGLFFVQRRLIHSYRLATLFV
jgi:hypothetical protein